MTMLYALSALVAPFFPVLLLILWVSYTEERDLARAKSLKGFWPVTLMYVSAGICLSYLTFVVYRALVSSFI